MHYSLSGFVVFALLLASGPVAADDKESPDEQLLREHKVGSDGPALIGFLTEWSLGEGDEDKLRELVRKLGARSFKTREEATAALIRRGPAARPHLETALKDADAEIVRRARQCLDAIGNLGPALPAAVVRQLGAKQPPGAVAALLRFVPYAGEEVVEQEVFAALLALTKKNPVQPDAPLLTALRDKLPARRAAAGHVLGRVAEKHHTEVRKLLDDPEARVRYHTAHGLLLAGDRSSVAPLISLLADSSSEWSWRAEDLLYRVVESAPTPGRGGDSPEDRKQYRDEWLRWWKDNERTAKLADLSKQPPHLDLTLIPEMHANRITEFGRDGKVRWKLDTGLIQPRCARVIAGGRLLIAEASGNRVTERDRKGNILWQFAVKDPAYVERLPNGNTFIGTDKRVFVVTPAGKETFSYAPGGDFYIHGMDRLRDGRMALMGMNGELRLVSADGKTIFSTRLEGGNWCHVEALANGRFLCTAVGAGEVREVDATGKTHWQHKLNSACCAHRLANGNTMILSFAGKKLVEVDPKGKTVWEHETGTSPWRFTRR